MLVKYWHQTEDPGCGDEVLQPTDVPPLREACGSDKRGTLLPHKVFSCQFLFTLDNKKCSTHISYSVNWQSLLKLIFEASFCSPRLIIYRKQAVTPLGDSSGIVMCQQTSGIIRIVNVVEMLKSGTGSLQHGSRLQRSS